MKTIRTIISLSTLALSAAVAAPEDYVNSVRQIQSDSGVEWDVTVAPQGQMLSPEGVGPKGSLYRLWSIHSLTGSEFLLDEEFVSSYSPVATIEILTVDPYETIPRTRADQPFVVKIEISGLLSPDLSGSIPVAATTVHLLHEGFLYPEGEHSLAPVQNPVGVELISGYINRNGNTTLSFPWTNLSGPDLTKLEGEEVFTVSSLEDYEVTESVLQSARVQIWPLAESSIAGLDPTIVYTDVPEVTVSLRDLYPDSSTHVRVYLGPPSASPSQVENLPTSYVVIDDVIPQDRTVVLDDLNDVMEETGNYTLEVLHTTPFGAEILDRFYPIQVSHGIKVRGTLFGFESN
jgi:hypothetical protein